ncbi:MAG: hypothetical protein ACMUIP_08790 [bacterium]
MNDIAGHALMLVNNIYDSNDLALSFKRKFLALTLLSFYVMCLISCSSSRLYECSKDGRQYCVTSDYVPLNTWDSCYRRGLSCMEGECWEYAITEFGKAIESRYRDKRHVRAYGMHFRDEYFPHRELGIAYFYTYQEKAGQDPTILQKALHELEVSLDQTPSARAKYYLNQVKRSYLLATSKDIVPPIINLDRSEKKYLTNQTPFIIKGKVVDDHYVAALSINATPLFIEQSENEISFTRPVDLEEGWTTIEIMATDLVDREAKKTIRVFLDRQGPLVISNPDGMNLSYSSQHIIVTALVFDKSGITSFTLNHKEVPLYGMDELCFIEERVSPSPGVASIPFEAHDRAGNVTKGEIALSASRRRRNLTAKVACLDPDGYLTYNTTVSHNTGNTDISLTVRYPEHDEIVTFHNEIFLEAEIDAHYGIKGIESTIEGVIEPAHEVCCREIPSPVNEISDFSLQNARQLTRKLEEQHYDAQKGEELIHAILRQNTFYYLNQRVPLYKDFTNQTLTIKAEDNVGNKISKTVHIVKVPRDTILKSEERMQLAIIPFGTELFSRGRQEYIYTTLIESLNAQERFHLLEKDELPWYLLEKGCTSEAMCTKEMVRKIASRTQAEGLICGNVNKWTMDGGIEIKASFREPEGGEECVFHDVFSPRDTVDDLRTIIAGLAMKFMDSFPVCTGKITRLDGDVIHVNIGAQKGILPCMRYNVFREEEELLNKAVIKQIDQESSEAAVIEEGTGREIGEGCLVRTR